MYDVSYITTGLLYVCPFVLEEGGSNPNSPKLHCGFGFASFLFVLFFWRYSWLVLWPDYAADPQRNFKNITFSYSPPCSLFLCIPRNLTLFSPCMLYHIKDRCTTVLSLSPARLTPDTIARDHQYTHTSMMWYQLTQYQRVTKTQQWWGKSGYNKDNS